MCVCLCLGLFHFSVHLLNTVSLALHGYSVYPTSLVSVSLQKEVVSCHECEQFCFHWWGCSAKNWFINEHLVISADVGHFLFHISEISLNSVLCVVWCHMSGWAKLASCEIVAWCDVQHSAACLQGVCQRHTVLINCLLCSTINKDRGLTGGECVWKYLFSPLSV